jgi:protein-tyrosine-phosphatase
MAEAYTKSIVGKEHSVSSSGIEAELGLNGEVDPVAVDELRSDSLDQHLSASWRQTTQSILDEADIVVFMSKSLFEESKKKFIVDESKSEVWKIPDIDGVYQKIKDSVDLLIER